VKPGAGVCGRAGGNFTVTDLGEAR